MAEMGRSGVEKATNRTLGHRTHYDGCCMMLCSLVQCDSRWVVPAVGVVTALMLPLAIGGCNEHATTDAEGRLINAVVVGETGTHPGQFMYPRAMDVYHDADGRTIGVIIDKTARMQAIDLSSDRGTMGGMLGMAMMPELSNGMPTGVTIGVSLFDADQLAAYVADTHEHRVLVYPLPLVEGVEPALSFGVFGEGEGEFVYPTDVIVRVGDDGAVEELLISEYGGNDRITRYRVERDEDGVELVWGGQIGTPSETVDGSDGEVALSRPQSIGVWERAEGDELIVVDSSHHRIGRLTMGGELIAWYARDRDANFAPMQFPYGVTVLDDGSALISEFGGNVVRRMDLESGMTVEMFGVGGRGDGELATPWTSDVIDGKLVILDSGNNRILMVGFDDAAVLARSGGYP